jgi:Flp pilus assembly protein TadD
MKLIAALVSVVLLCACAASPTVERGPDLLNDRLFAPPTTRIEASDVFAVSPEMRQFLAAEVQNNQWHARGTRRALVDALYKKDQLKLDYDGTTTHNAAEAFAARSGNCLSLVIMTAAFAKELGLPVRYQQAFVDPTYSRLGNVYLAVGHVNLTLGPTRMDGVYGTNGTDLMMIDFLPPSDLRGLRTWIVEEKTIVAMYMNNHAVEAITRDEIDNAYWWAREAIRQDPHFISAYNTLGVVYWRHGNLPQARQTLGYVLEHERANTNAMSNLILVLNDQGRTAEAEELSRKLAQLEPNPPFSYFNRGMAAMQSGDYKLARDMFRKEVDRAAYYHEFHFWLAMAEMRLGEYDNARENLKIAMETSPTRDERDLYSTKLERIRSGAVVRCEHERCSTGTNTKH